MTSPTAHFDPRRPNRAVDADDSAAILAVVTDGSAVLGPLQHRAGPCPTVMDGNCLIFKAFAGVDGFPLCLATQDTNEIVETVNRIAPVFGGITWRILSRLTTPPLAY